MEAVVVSSYHLHKGVPTHKEGEGEHRRKMVDNADAFHVFGCPVSINGERTLMWIAATHRKGESDPNNLTFYEFGVSEGTKKTGETSLVHGPNPHRTEASPVGDTLADVLRGVKSNFEGKPEIVEKNSKEHDSLELAEAKKQGMFKDGKMVAGNAVITELGVTHFSVAGMCARTAGANMEASYVDPADGKRKFGEIIV